MPLLCPSAARGFPLRARCRPGGVFLVSVREPVRIAALPMPLRWLPEAEQLERPRRRFAPGCRWPRTTGSSIPSARRRQAERAGVVGDERRLSPERAVTAGRAPVQRGRARRVRERRRLGEALLRVLTAARADGGLGRDEGCVRRLQFVRGRRFVGLAPHRRGRTSVRLSRLDRRQQLEPEPPLCARGRRRAVDLVRRAVPTGKDVPSRSSRSRTRRHGSATCEVASETDDRRRTRTF